MLVWIGAGLSLVAILGAGWRLAAYLTDRTGSQPPKNRPSHARDGDDAGVDHSFIPTRFIPTRRSEDFLGASGGGDGDSDDGGGGDGGD